MRVVYIAGWGRSGTTLLDMMLGQLPGFFSVGELRSIWDRNLLSDGLCGCGKPTRDCPRWTEIFRQAFGGWDGVDARRLIRLRDSMVRLRHVPSLLHRADLFGKSGPEAEYVETLSRLYGGIGAATGCSTVVDSSKLPGYLLALEHARDVELYVIHMVRDPRAVAWSWQRRRTLVPEDVRDRPGVDPSIKSSSEASQDLLRFSPLYSTAVWVMVNDVMERWGEEHPERYRLLRYEDLIADPSASMRSIASMLGASDSDLPFLSGDQVVLTPTHTTSGNPARFRTGPVRLRLDDEWRRQMGWGSRSLVGAMSWPQRTRYGYSGSLPSASAVQGEDSEGLWASPRFKAFPPGIGHVKVPLTSRGAAASALALYAPCRPGAVSMHRIALAAIRTVGARALPGRSAPWSPPMEKAAWLQLCSEWRGLVGDFDDFAVSQRSQPHRSGFCVLLLADGEARAFVKLASTGDKALEHEFQVMQRMSRWGPSSFSVPEPLGWGSAGGWDYVALAAIPSPRHRVPRKAPLNTILGEIDAALDTLPCDGSTPDHWRPMHGNLTPWNLRELPNGRLVLFDWEDASWGPPGADDVMYRASLAALGGRHPGVHPAREAVDYWYAQAGGRAKDTRRDKKLDRSLYLVLARMRMARPTPGSLACTGATG